LLPQFPMNNWDAAGYSEIGNRERPENISPTRQSLSHIPLATEEPKLYIPKPPRNQLIEIFKFRTSSVANLDYPIKFPLIPKYEISKGAEDFISRQKKSVKYRENLLVISDKAKEFLKKESIESQITISLFTDPEYSNWVETKITIIVPKKDFRKAYGLYNELLSYSLKGVSKKTLEKVVVGFEHL